MCRFQPSRSIWASLSAPGFSRVRKRVGSAGVTSSRDLLGVGTQTRHMTPQKRAVRKCLKSRNTQPIGLCGVVQRYTPFSDKTRTEECGSEEGALPHPGVLPWGVGGQEERAVRALEAEGFVNGQRAEMPVVRWASSCCAMSRPS